MLSLVTQPKNIKPQKVVRIKPEWKRYNRNFYECTITWEGERLDITYTYKYFYPLKTPPEQGSVPKFETFYGSGGEQTNDFSINLVISPSDLQELGWLILTNCNKVRIVNKRGDVVLDYTDE